MKKLLGLFILMALVMNVSPVFADDYHERNFINRLSDWSVTFWKSPDDRDRIINERTEKRAQWRESRHKDRGNNMERNYNQQQRNSKEDNGQKDYEQKRYDNNH